MNYLCRAYAILVLLALLPFQSARATDVSGEISADTTWLLANSPYTVTSNLTINARLTIQAGVTVYLMPGTGIRVERTLIAQGTAQAPITFTSTHARPGSPTTPQPGDWSHIEIATQPSVAQGGPWESTLEHVRIQYGAGLLIQEAAPLLSNISFEDNLGAAVSMSLDAAPHGSGLTATGNLVNGIVVPAGTVTSGRFSLRGIPYVLQSGLLRVGQTAVELSAPQTVLQQGASVYLSLRLAEPAPPTGLAASISSSNPGILEFEPTQTIAAGSNEALIPVMGLELGDTDITAEIAGLGSDTISLRVADLPLLSLESGALNVPVGRVRTLSVQIPQAAPPEGLVVNLLADEPSRLGVPATANIAAGSTVTNVTLTGISPGSVTVSASAPGYQPTSKGNIQVVPLTLSWPTTVIVPPGTSNVRLDLSDPAPPGGLSVGLTSNTPQVLTVPAAVSVPAGATHVLVPMTGVFEGQATVEAAASGYGSAQKLVNVEIINLSFDLTSYTISLGLDEPFTVRSSKPAPAGGLVVNLSSADPAVASVSPASVTIPAGQTSAPVRADVLAVASGTTSITAHGEGLLAGNLNITVGGAPQLTFVQSSIRVGKGLRTVSGPELRVERDGISVTSRRARTFSVQSADPAVFTVPATVSIPAGSTSAVVRVTGVSNSMQAVVLSAEAPSYISTTLPVEVVQPALQFIDLDGERSMLDGRDLFQLRWFVSGQTPGSQVAAQTQIVSVQIVQPDPTGLVSGVYLGSFGGQPITETVISAGNSSSSSLSVGEPLALGSYRIQAAYDGESHLSQLQSIRDYQLTFNMEQEVVGLGLRTEAVRIMRRVNGNPDTAGTIQVSISSSDPSRVQVPTQVTIFGGQSSVVVPLSGLGLANLVQINASSPRYKPATSLDVQVINPHLGFRNLDGDRVNAGDQDQFRVVWSAAGASTLEQTALESATVALAIVDANPEGIVELSDGSQVISSVEIPAGDSGASAVITSPTSSGSYRVSADTATAIGGPWLSELQVVSGNALSFELDDGFPTTSVGLYLERNLNLLGATATPIEVVFSTDPAGVLVSMPNIIFEPGTGDQTRSVRLQGQSVGTTVLSAGSLPASLPQTELNIEVVAAEVEFVRASNSEFYLSFISPGLAPQPLSVQFSIVQDAPGGIVSIVENAVIDIQESTNSTNYGGYPQRMTRLSFSGAGVFRLQAVIDGIGTFVSEEYSTGAPIELQIQNDELQVGRGLVESVNLVLRQGEDAPLLSKDVEVSVACAPSKICFSDSPVTMYASQGASTTAWVQGLQLGNATFTANTVVYGDAAIPVEVVEPEVSMNFYIADGEFNVGDSGQLFYQIGTNGSCQSVMTEIQFMVSADPPNLVSGMPANVTLEVDNCSGDFEIQGIAAGTFTVTLSAPGVGNFTSEPITVLP